MSVEVVDADAPATSSTCKKHAKTQNFAPKNGTSQQTPSYARPQSVAPTADIRTFSDGAGRSASPLPAPACRFESTGFNPDLMNIPAAEYVDMQILKQQHLNQNTPLTPQHFRKYAAKPLTQSLFRLSDFELFHTLGTGTFGRVYLAKYKGNEKYFAIKSLKKRDVIRLSQLEHIYCEKHLLSQLRHPFIVNLYATFHDRTHLFMLMEYAIGGELFSYLRRAGRFCLQTTQFYVAEIVLALEYLHAYGIVYRDLKPENLLLDARGHIKLTDFGFAKLLDGNKTWTLCGTPEYLAPEIILGKGHGMAVDWWALGILVFEMLAGYPPFYADSNYAIYEKILKGVYVFPDFVDAVSRDFVRRLLVVDVTRRLGSSLGGVLDVKTHPFFRGVQWAEVWRRSVQAPFAPFHAHPGDSRNFERYDEEAPEDQLLDDGATPIDDYAAVFQFF